MIFLILQLKEKLVINFISTISFLKKKKNTQKAPKSIGIEIGRLKLQIDHPNMHSSRMHFKMLSNAFWPNIILDAFKANVVKWSICKYAYLKCA